MEAPNVKIKYLKAKEGHRKINTSEGVKKLDENNEIDVSIDLALQLVDNENWSCKQNLQMLAKKYQIGQVKPKQVIEDDEDELEDSDEQDEQDVVSDEEVEDMGDEETKELIKQIPTMKFVALKEAAENAGIDTSDYTKAERKKLARLVIKTLRGK